MLPDPRPLLPPDAPLAMPEQDFARDFHDADAPARISDCGQSRQAGLWRVLTFSPAMLATLALALVISGWFAQGGTTVLEGVLLALIAFNFFWITFTVSTVLLGLFGLSRRDWTPERGPRTPMRVALLVPTYNELPSFVLGNARSMLEELRARSGGHTFEMFILSDTRDESIAQQERIAVEALRADMCPDIALYYRRRDDNTARKVGNISDWVRRWGGNYEAMLVLDADSLMTGRAIRRLTNALARDPSAGLIQSFPQLIGAQSVFGRMQQFANGVYGLALAEGLARWAGHEGNYWGHNAIIRTKAFAACAGLPEVRNLRGKPQLIMSHDFVEAGLLRRAGWRVRFLPRIRGSYEETPATLIDHVQRDRRWCQGNLQHLQLLGARGFHAMSRFHLAHGAIGYLMAPLWFALLVIWALIGRSEEASVITYFSEANPTRPSWPDMSEPRHVAVVLLIYAMLLAPKLLSVVALPLTGRKMAEFGGLGRFLLSMTTEILLAILYAPILMVQQMIAVFRTVLGLQKGWAPQMRDGGAYSWGTLAKFHGLETVVGVALAIGVGLGLVSLWLAPIALSLVLAVPLSALSGLRLRLMGTAEDLNAPQISRAAQHYRGWVAQVLSGAGPAHPAE
ncbi:Glucans biosynthesis glucosyltransferase H [Tritonibacter multivorans]|uniref:Glucans biosynthesis glucosyltransferase H n=1 Tax=Tritonibacter multivorans TaxID=928856 RepID=A0A0P1GHY9_9RHOB|nr:glucans biosynthesis glucosyltransferase MdoH [Tritonibacter multivorans]MDA7420567.1 glucans biosynthesis glucosyltransferase MdoH [Tritonibacter multivorans]CUH81360.1 Glucans biosynthesis glucosyltransferase H [Tritonibacter multivorans]SFC33684.1 membrane glycosyltransferase [Tritonibacter multivorans]